MTSRTETAANKAFEDTEAKREAFDKASKAVAEKAAVEFENIMKELGIDHSSFHMTWAENNNQSAHQELVASIQDTFLQAVHYPDADQEAQSAADDAYFAVAAE